MLILLPITSSEITAALSLAGIFNFDQRIRKLKGNNVIFHLLNRKGRLPFKNEHMLTAKNSYWATRLWMSGLFADAIQSRKPI
jgi:hypothetical protein